MRWPTSQPPFRTLGFGSLSFMSRYFCQGTGLLMAGAAASLAWPANNRAIYLPFESEVPMLVTQMWLWNGATATGNVDMGLYSDDNVRIVSMGATAQSGTNQIQTLNITDTVIGRGRFYLGISLSSTSGTVFRSTSGAVNDYLLWGALQEASAHPLPATMTPASNQLQYVPLCGFVAKLV